MNLQKMVKIFESISIDILIDDRKTVPKKRGPRPSKRKMPVFEEGDACEEIVKPTRPSKRRKSEFKSDLIDPDTGGKIQLTFEECLKKAAEKNKTTATQKTTKTLDHFFSKSKADEKSKKEAKKEVNVDDFFSSASHKVSFVKTYFSYVVSN